MIIVIIITLYFIFLEDKYQGIVDFDSRNIISA